MFLVVMIEDPFPDGAGPVDRLAGLGAARERRQRLRGNLVDLGLGGRFGWRRARLSRQRQRQYQDESRQPHVLHDRAMDIRRRQV
ncbi:MAG: hypothetical protein IPK26_27195 [Planctomycetes bacterium]|nr:hypothetical protein [Planctomycetota bacterium]